MTSILDQFVNRHQPFRPRTMDELIALRLAQKLGDDTRAADYALLVAEHPPERLVAAYRRVLKSGQKSDRANRFHAELQHVNGRMAMSPDVRLLAVKVERRSIAAALFVGTTLEFTDVRHLSSRLTVAQASAVGFTEQLLSDSYAESVALESVPAGKEIRRTVLTEAIIKNCMQSHGIPLWQLPKRQLLDAFGSPPLRFRKQLREVVLSLWPVLNGGTGLDQTLDAVALGALVQVERLFLH